MLTDKACKALKPKDKSYKVADAQGLYLEVMPNGSKYWRFRYRIAGKDKRMALGVYPEISLENARDGKNEARKLLKTGIDPSTAKREHKRQKTLNQSTTFESVARDWHAHFRPKWSDRHAQTILNRLERDLFPLIGKTPLTEVTTPYLLSVIQNIEERGAHEVARRAVQVCGHIFRYAAIMGRSEHNPAENLKGVLKPYKKGHFAAFEARDIPEFLKKLERNEARLFEQTRLAIEMMLLTFVRTGELIKAKWDEFDLNERMWLIPAERMKMRKDHMVPLSTRTCEILKELTRYSGHLEYVFPSQTNPRSHMSNNTILKALGRMGYKGIMTGHGFRALAMSTIKEKLGYRHEVIDRQLAHAHKNDIDKAYDRSTFLDDRITMMQDWADYVKGLQYGTF